MLTGICGTHHKMPVACRSRVPSTSRHLKSRSKLRRIVTGRGRPWPPCSWGWFKLGLNCDQKCSNFLRFPQRQLKRASLVRPTSDHCSSRWTTENYVIAQHVWSLICVSSPLCVAVLEPTSMCVFVCVCVHKEKERGKSAKGESKSCVW